MSSFFKTYKHLIARGKIEADAAQLAAAAALDALSGQLAKQRRWLGLFSSSGAAASIYLWGGVGRGKSMLMDLFFDRVQLKRKRRVHFLEFMQETHARLKNLRQAHSGDPIYPLTEAMRDKMDLLCLDEFQVNDIADASILGRLFSALLEAGVVFVMTSNRAPDDLYLGGLNRDRFLPFIDLIKREAHIIDVGSGKDYRRATMLGTQRYYLNDSAMLRQNFARLTHGTRARKGELDIGGRKLPIPKHALGCAYFHFNDLCARPLGGADYLALAHAFHTMVIDGIPVLRPSMRNEARRFIHLIDVLYDNRILLIANAAARPENLYPSGDGRAEFARTISRLTEMQSADYMPEKRSEAV